MGIEFRLVMVGGGVSTRNEDYSNIGTLPNPSVFSPY
jgi:hypothetical protein